MNLMITAEMIEQADSKHHMQFYETGKHGTTFEFGAPITPMDFAIDTPIEKSSWTPTRLADYIESQRKNPEMAFEVKGCEND